MGKYYTQLNWEGHPLQTQVDPNISFKNNILLNSVYILNWDMDRFPFPLRFPQYSTEWTGYIKIPEVKENEAGGKKEGLLGNYYYTRDFSSKPFLTRIDHGITLTWRKRRIGPRSNPKPLSIEWSGYISIPEGGTYSFAARSGGSSKVIINDQLIVENRGGNELVYKPGSKYLAEGDHKIEVHYEDNGFRSVMNLFWTPPGKEESLIPAKALYHIGSKNYALALESSNEGLISVGDRLLIHIPSRGSSRLIYSDDLEPGVHPISIKFTGAPKKGSRLILYWRSPNGKVEIIPKTSFYPTGGELSKARWKRAIFISLISLVILFLIWVNLARGSRISHYFYGYLNFTWSKRVYFALLLILLLATFLRFHQYDIVPFHNESSDEYRISWLGWNLIHEGAPITWAPRDRAPSRYWFGKPFTINDPVFYPQPLFPLIVGGAATLGGANNSLFESSLSYIRLPSIALSVLTAFLVFILGRKLYDEKVALLATLLYATIPIIVVSGRMAKEENLMTPLFLLALLSILRYLDSGGPKYRNLAGLMAGLALLAKPTGISLIAVILILLAYQGKWKDMIKVGIIFTGVSSLHLFYGWWYGWDGFVNKIGELGSAFVRKLDVGVMIIRESRITTRSFGDGWALWFWMGLIYLSTKKDRIIPTIVIVHLLGLAALIGARGVWDGWQRIPFYPFLCIAVAVFLYDLHKKPDLFRSIIFIIVAVMASLQYYLPSHLTSSVTFLRFAIASSAAPFFLYAAFGNRITFKIARFSLYALLLIFTIINILIVLNFVDINSSLGAV